MSCDARQLIDRLSVEHCLDIAEYALLVCEFSADLARYAALRAEEARASVYGRDVFARGLIEIGNVCANDCLYCGVRKSNKLCERYRLSLEEIVACAEEGYELGMRTFVLQGGEDPRLSDERLCEIVGTLKAAHPDCAVTLSVGERTRESYQRLFEAGVDRYLLRHETADEHHYRMLHPTSMSWERRMECLRDLKGIGFATGCGFMVGSPFQTPASLARDLKFVEEFQPAMCGIGPFVPHHATPFSDEPRGSADLTCYLLSLLRIIEPNLLLPATTALGTADAEGFVRGVRAGANVIMPNLTPARYRALYDLYDGKAGVADDAATRLGKLREDMSRAGYEIVVDRGDARPLKRDALPQGAPFRIESTTEEVL